MKLLSVDEKKRSAEDQPDLGVAKPGQESVLVQVVALGGLWQVEISGQCCQIERNTQRLSVSHAQSQKTVCQLFLWGHSECRLTGKSDRCQYRRHFMHSSLNVFDTVLKPLSSGNVSTVFQVFRQHIPDTVPTVTMLAATVLTECVEVRQRIRF